MSMPHTLWKGCKYKRILQHLTPQKEISMKHEYMMCMYTEKWVKVHWSEWTFSINISSILLVKMSVAWWGEYLLPLLYWSWVHSPLSIGRHPALTLCVCVCVCVGGGRRNTCMCGKHLSGHVHVPLDLWLTSKAPLTEDCYQLLKIISIHFTQWSSILYTVRKGDESERGTEESYMPMQEESYMYSSLTKLFTHCYMYYFYQPFGRPSCCSSLSRASPLTLCLAALLKMKARAAIAALMSESSYLASDVSLLTLVYYMEEKDEGKCSVLANERSENDWEGRRGLKR